MSSSDQVPLKYVQFLNVVVYLVRLTVRLPKRRTDRLMTWECVCCMRLCSYRVCIILEWIDWKTDINIYKDFTLCIYVYVLFYTIFGMYVVPTLLNNFSVFFQHIIVLDHYVQVDTTYILLFPYILLHYLHTCINCLLMLKPEQNSMPLACVSLVLVGVRLSRHSFFVCI